jgi:hypothetical protein
MLASFGQPREWRGEFCVPPSFARCVETICDEPRLHQCLAEAAHLLVTERGWRAQAPAGNSWLLIVPGSFSSWGEVLSLQVKGHSVLIESKCRFVLQITGWQKTRWNVEMAQYYVQRCLA